MSGTDNDGTEKNKGKVPVIVGSSHSGPEGDMEEVAEQYILGINGWDVRSHDASASLIKCSPNGVEIIAAAEEERFSRKKHAYDTLPIEATRFCLEYAGISPEDISTIAFSWDMPLLYKFHGLDENIDTEVLMNKLFGQHLRSYPHLEFINHHLSHALSAYGPSGFQSSAILIIDGQGELESTTLWKAKGNRLELISSSDISASLGYFYEALSGFVGFDFNQAGKTMGLAPYGDKYRFLEELRSLFRVEDLIVKVPQLELNIDKDDADGSIDEQEPVRNFWLERFMEITGLKPNERSSNYSFRSFPKAYLDFAASGQELLAEIIVELAEALSQKTGETNLSLGGGVALNCVANGRILENPNLKIYVQPAANDAGTSVGAALEIARREDFCIAGVKMTPYLGKEYSNEEVLKAIKDSGVPYKEEENMFAVIRQLISQGKVVGLFQGRFEFGPRALGNRSFIADPRSFEMWDYINSEIKGREEGRPLAATILDTEAQSLFGKEIAGPHMTITYPLVDDRLKAVEHVDGSTRPQILKYDDNPLFYQQISEAGKDIGIDALINTSLNFQGPIVNSPQEALELFQKTKVDAIIFNNTYIAYRNQKEE